MTFLNPAYQQNASYTARDDRLIWGSLIPNHGKVSGLNVLQNSTPGMAVRVTAGSAFVTMTAQAYQGVYHVVSTGVETVTLDPAHSSYARIDKIVLTVRDSAFGGADNDAIIRVIKGAASSSPAVPSTPPNSIVLATVRVNTKVTAVTTSNISVVNVADIARVSYSLAPQSIKTLSTARPTQDLTDGMVILETDTGLTRFREGSTWKYLAGQVYASGTIGNVVQSNVSGWTISAANGIVRSGTVQGYVTFTRNGSTINVNSTGNIVNSQICVVKPNYRPGLTAALSTLGTGRTAGGYILPSGEVKLANVAPGADITNGETFTLGWTGVINGSLYSA